MSTEPEPKPLALGASELVTLALIVAIACVPTLGSLGYPSALMTAPMIALFGVRVGLRQLPRGARVSGVTLRRLARQGLGRVGLVAGLALAILAASSAAQGSADYLFGAACFLLGPLASGALGWVCGVVAGAVSERRIARALLAYAPFIACVVVALARLYRDPAVFGFDPFWGMFSGGIYDQDTEIGAAYFVFRAYNAVVAVGALITLWLAFDVGAGRASWRTLRARVDARRGLAFTAGLLVAGGAVAGTNPTRFGFHQTTASLRRELSATRETEHFVLRYRPASAWARDIDAFADECELWWNRYAEVLIQTPPPPIEVFLFDSPWDKRELLGVGFAELAAPWRRQLYLNYAPDPHGVLPHELAHAFGAPFGDPLFGLAIDFPQVDGGLIEGFAEALAGRRGQEVGQHTRAAILDRLGLRPPLESLFGSSFWSVAPARAYDTAGSFCAWLGDKNARGLAELYGNGAEFEAIYGRSLPELEQEWLAFLRERALREEDIELQRQRFERRSVFARPHAYQVARLQRRLARALGAGELARAARLQDRIVALEPAVPEHRLGRVRLLGARGATDAALSELELLLAGDQLADALRGAALELLGDLRYERDELEEARAAWELAADRPSSGARRRLLALKDHATRAPARAALWRRYLRPFDLASSADTLASARLNAAEELRERPDERALGAYLAARQLVALGEREHALELIDDFVGPPDEEPRLTLPGFDRAARELALTITARCGELDRAWQQLELLNARAQAEGDGDRYADWSYRLSFLSERR